MRLDSLYKTDICSFIGLKVRSSKIEVLADGEGLFFFFTVPSLQNLKVPSSSAFLRTPIPCAREEPTAPRCLLRHHTSIWLCWQHSIAEGAHSVCCSCCITTLHGRRRTFRIMEGEHGSTDAQSLIQKPASAMYLPLYLKDAFKMGALATAPRLKLELLESYSPYRNWKWSCSATVEGPTGTPGRIFISKGWFLNAAICQSYTRVDAPKVYALLFFDPWVFGRIISVILSPFFCPLIHWLFKWPLLQSIWMMSCSHTQQLCDPKPTGRPQVRQDGQITGVLYVDLTVHTKSRYGLLPSLRSGVGGHGSVGRVLAVQIWGPEFKTPGSRKS